MNDIENELAQIKAENIANEIRMKNNMNELIKSLDNGMIDEIKHFDYKEYNKKRKIRNSFVNKFNNFLTRINKVFGG